MTQLHSREVDLFRSLKRTAIVLMVLFRLDRPLGECEIAGVLEMDRGTIRIYLRSLARQGMVTRSHRFHGWILTAGGRQMVLGESVDGRLEAQVSERRPMVDPPPSFVVENPPSVVVETPPSLPETTAHAGVRVEKPPSVVENPSSMAEIPSSLPPTNVKADRMVENPPLLAEDPSSSAENPSTRVEYPPSMMEISRSNAENPPSSGKISRSRLRPRFRKIKKADRSAHGNGRCDTAFRANLEAFASIGLVQNDFVSAICRMDHVTPGYILGQKRRLEAEGRYSGGLLLQVVKCGDALPEKYVGNGPENPPRPPLIRGEKNRPERHSPLPLGRGEKTPAQLLEAETEIEDWPSPIHEFEPDASIHKPLSMSGMTAARAWPAVLRELQSDMPKSAYDKWVRDTVLLSARDGIFVIGAQSSYTRDWLESRLTSTITRFLSGICNRSMEVRFANLNVLENLDI